ncbi:MAG: hypothetical protein M3Y72_22735 [Acidobacteriota bacterium]|nr:hypothetical protein [Acidobacteriota bacterium]
MEKAFVVGDPLAPFEGEMVSVGVERIEQVVVGFGRGKRGTVSRAEILARSQALPID